MSQRCLFCSKGFGDAFAAVFPSNSSISNALSNWNKGRCAPPRRWQSLQSRCRMDLQGIQRTIQIQPMHWSEKHHGRETSRFILIPSLESNLLRLAQAVASGPWPILLEGLTIASSNAHTFKFHFVWISTQSRQFFYRNGSIFRMRQSKVVSTFTHDKATNKEC